MKKNNGFTIVEFLIASTVFTIVLVTALGLIVSFTRHFYKAVNSSTTQSGARTIITAVSNAIEFAPQDSIVTSASNNSTGVDSYCIGYTQFDYKLYAEQGYNSKNAIWETNSAIPNGTCTTNSTPQSTSIILLSNNMRLINFNVSPVAQDCLDQCNYRVTAVVAYGNNSVLCNTSKYQNCTTNGSDNASVTNGWSSLTSSTTGCVQTVGTQFCDVASLTSTIGMRL